MNVRRRIAPPGGSRQPMRSLAPFEAPKALIGLSPLWVPLPDSCAAANRMPWVSALHLARDGAVIEHQLVAARIDHDLPAIDAFRLVELRRDDDPHSGVLHLIHGDQ